ncbi:MAG: NAD-dependent succinate-semialdehyde dehydrogenase [Bacteroidota bacterium]
MTGTQNTFAVHNPATQEVLAQVPNMGQAEAASAISVALEAFDDWRGRLAGERAAILRAWRDLILEHEDMLAVLVTAEMGKPLTEARSEVRYGASFAEWFAEEAKRVYGDVIPTHRSDARIITLKQPIGVVGAITPWNFPVAMVTRKVAPALAAGCTVVLKPAEATPLSALALATLAQQAGFPAGVVQVITTDAPAAVGLELTSNPLVRKISFTGSTGVGKKLFAQSADTIKKLSLELGGNAPFIVFDDADIDAAVAGAIASKYRNSGQTCVCANRLFVQHNVYDAFVEKYTAAVKALRIGNGFEDVQIGPLINTAALEKVEHIVADALAHGAQLKAGGKRAALGGTFYQPTVLTEASMDMRCATEEIFGPVSPVFRFHSDEEVISMANATPYGLAAYFFARDIGRVWRVAEQLEYGMVGINTSAISTTVAPFGGMKESGMGREGSKYGLSEYVEMKYLCMGGL